MYSIPYHRMAVYILLGISLKMIVIIYKIFNIKFYRFTKIRLILFTKQQNIRNHTFFHRVFKNKRITKTVQIGFLSVFGILLFSTFILPRKVEASFIAKIFKNAEANDKNADNTIQNMVLPDPNDQISLNTDNKKSVEKKLAFSNGFVADDTGPLGTEEATHVVSTGSDLISTYTVHAGDSLPEIAEMFDVSVNTLKWANKIGKKDSIKEGDILVILPVTGVSYTVKKGDTLKSITQKFNADVDDVGVYNGLEVTSELTVGQTIIVPNGEISEPVPQKVLAKDQKTKSSTKNKKETSSKKGLLPLFARGATRLIDGFDGSDEGNYYIRPVRGGVRTQGLHGKNGVDIGAAIGTPVYATAGGTVSLAREGGWNGGYGNYIIISHPNGTQSLYGHLNSVNVSQGQSVGKGDMIGTLGNSGNSTGPHLHFEIRGAKNPLGSNPSYGL